MMQLRRVFVEQAAQWDTPTRLGLTIAAVLLAMALGLATLGPASLRTPAAISAAVLMVVAQVIVLWGNRRMVTPFTQAQRHYLRGEFEAAASVLEAHRSSGEKVDVQDLTLLGNTYRQMGRLDESAEVLSEAVDISPANHFPLLGYGRTLLYTGAYETAATYLQAALDHGAPDGVLLDLAEAQFREGQTDAARQTLQRMTSEPQEAHRVLLWHWLKAGDDVPVDVVDAGLEGYRAIAERYAHTPYGMARLRDVRELGAYIHIAEE